AADDPDRGPRPADERAPALLPRRAARPGGTRLHHAQASDAPARRGGAPRPLPRSGARRADACRDDGGRRLAAGDAARRDPAALERAPRRHEPRRAAADPATLLRGARDRPAGVLAAPRRPPWPDRLRAGPPRLRDIDGREARPRPRVDRRPLGSALPAHADRDRVARAQAVAPVLDVEPRVLEIEVAE